jgi:oxygen-independent coproporphyrinogen-3 oxidase
VHMQNLDRWETYSGKIREGQLPLSRAYRPDREERLIRELVLQLKLGRVRPSYFSGKYGVDILERFADPLRSLDADGFLAEATAETVALTRAGLLRVDSLLPRFFQPQHAGIRYT